VETNTDGVFLAGCAQGPRDVPDTVAHAGAAASMAIALLDKGEVTISPTIAKVDEKLCSACKTCLSICPYTAITFDAEANVAKINDALCAAAGPAWPPARPGPSRGGISPMSRSTPRSKRFCANRGRKARKECPHERKKL